MRTFFLPLLIVAIFAQDEEGLKSLRETNTALRQALQSLQDAQLSSEKELSSPFMPSGDKPPEKCERCADGCEIESRCYTWEAWGATRMFCAVKFGTWCQGGQWVPHGGWGWHFEHASLLEDAQLSSSRRNLLYPGVGRNPPPAACSKCANGCEIEGTRCYTWEAWGATRMTCAFKEGKWCQGGQPVSYGGWGWHYGHASLLEDAQLSSSRRNLWFSWSPPPPAKCSKCANGCEIEGTRCYTFEAWGATRMQCAFKAGTWCQGGQSVSYGNWGFHFEHTD